MSDSQYKTDKVVTGGKTLLPIEVRSEGVPVAGAPHSVIKFKGADVDALDAGSGRARIVVTGLSGGDQDVCLNLTPPSGSWVGPCARATTSGTVFSNRALFIPIVIYGNLTFDQIGVHSAEPAGPADFELGIYNHAAGYPDVRQRLVQVPGSGPTGDNKIALPTPISLLQGIYWLALWNGANVQSFEIITPVQTKESNAMQFNTGTFRVPSLAYQLLTSGGLPATITPASLTGQTFCPIILLRRA